MKLMSQAAVERAMKLHQIELIGYEAPLNQVRNYPAGVFFCGPFHRIKCDLRTDGRFVGIIDTREIFNLAFPRLSIHALYVSLLAYSKRRVDKDFDEAL